MKTRIAAAIATSLLVVYLLYPQTSNYPATFDSDSTLYVVADNVMSTLSQAVTTSDNVIFVASGTGFLANMILTVCDTTVVVATGVNKCTAWEHMLLTSAAGQALTVTRGIAGTSARSHVKGAVVSVFIDSAHQQALKSAVMQIQKWVAPVANIRGFGAVCDGTDQNTAAQAALTAGAKRIFIPAGCTWVVPGGNIPDGLEIQGEDSQTSRLKSATDPSTTVLSAGKNVILKTINALGRTCSYQPQDDCRIDYYRNYRDTADNIILSGSTSFAAALGPPASNPTKDIALFNVRNFGNGDGWFSAEYGNGVGLRAEVYGQSGISSGIAALIGRRSVDNQPSTNPAGTGLLLQTFQGAEHGGSDLAFYTDMREDGNFITANQRGKTFTGNFLQADMADVSGDFTGAFLLFSKAGVQQYRVGNNGYTSQAGQLTISLPTGSPPLAITSTTPVPNLTGQVRAYKGGTQQTNSFMQFGTCTLSGGTCAATLSPAYASGTSYQCTGTDQTAAAAVKVANTSASVATFTGTGTDVVAFTCVGN